MAKGKKSVLDDRVQIRASVSFLLKSAIYKKAQQENKSYGAILDEILLSHPDMLVYIRNVESFYDY
jgi:hypothetical protein